MTNPSSEKIDLIKNSCSYGKVIDMAKNDPDWHVRLAAVENIDDENILKEIVNKELTSSVAIKAMEQISDEEFLSDICLNNPDSYLRLACINRISDESLLPKKELSSLLQRMLLNDSDVYVLKSVCENPNLDNQDVLIEVATSSDNELIQRQLIRKITDENTLTDFALDDENPFVRREAIQNPNLCDLQTICKIISHDCDEFNRIMAIYKIPDKESLLEIIYNESLQHRLSEIAENTNFSLNDYFLNIIETEDDEYKRRVGVNFIEDGDVLEDIILNESGDDIRADAIKNRNFNNQEILEELIGCETSPKILFEVVSKIENQMILTDYIKNNLEYNDVIVKAISKVEDLTLLKELSFHSDSRIRFEAVKMISKFDDEEFLMDIALTESDEKTCLEAIKSIRSRIDLIDIAGKRQEKAIRLIALNRIKARRLLDNYNVPVIRSSLNDLPFEAALKDMALHDDDLEIRKIATGKLDDKQDLDEIISIGDATSKVAQDRLNDLFEDIKRIDNEFILKELTCSLDNDVSAMAQATLDDLNRWESRIAQVNEIDDIDVLKDISQNDFNYFVRCEAEGKLEKLLFNIRLDEIESDYNQEKLRAIVNDENFSFEIRRKALLKITDESIIKVFEEKLN